MDSQKINEEYLDGVQRWEWRNDTRYLLPTFKCPYGNDGDILWVRETWSPTINISDAKFWYKASAEKIATQMITWKPNIHMPKEACRLFLEIKGITAERLQDITEEDAIAEGIEPIESFESGSGISQRQLYKNYLPTGYSELLPKDSFQSLWESINGVGSWDKNPWVWVIEFERCDKPSE